MRYFQKQKPLELTCVKQQISQCKSLIFPRYFVVLQKLKITSNNLIVSDKATISIDGKSYDFPVYRGVEDDVCIDIKTLRGVSGATTIDRGFKNTASCESKITYLDGEKGILRYRGYDLDELANKASFLEVAYLLIFGELPTCLLYTSPSPRDVEESRMPSSA